ncbi:FliG C-terminal domain-containing protein [Henriciella sp. AS95]|uniref:FliG C-terminal domain-containing protein n=1 Tax=Henriciella sp. AS95 TaxID=3135782 RepID=UPI0031812038
MSSSVSKQPASNNVARLKPRAASQSAVVNSISPSQRAAVIIAVLGEAAAKPIVEKLDDTAMARIAAGLETVQYLERDELAEIVMDFLQHLRQSSGAFRGGKARAREIVETLLDENRLDQVFGGGSSLAYEEAPVVDDSDVWGRLEQKDPVAIAGYLDGLTPNIAALILRKLDVSIASEVVSNLSDETLDPTIGFLVDVERPDPEIDAVIARMIELEFLNTDEGNEEEGTDSNLEAVGEILSLIPGAKRERLLAFLKSQHEGKLESIEKVLFTIEGLPDMLPRNSVPVVFRELGEDGVVPVLSTLTGPLQPVADYLLSNISSRLADQFRDAVADPNRKPVEDAETCQREFLTALMSLKRRGAITMEKSAAKA